MTPGGVAGIWSHTDSSPLPALGDDAPLVIPERSRIIVSTRQKGVGLELWLDTAGQAAEWPTPVWGHTAGLRYVHTGEIAVEEGVRIGAPPFGSMHFRTLESGTYPVMVWVSKAAHNGMSAIVFGLPSIADPFAQWPPAPGQVSGEYLHARLEDVLGMEDRKALQTLSWRDGVAEIGVLEPEDPVADRIRQALTPLPVTIVKKRIIAL